MVSVERKTGVKLECADGSVVTGSEHRWQVIDRVGKGGFGVVYRVQRADGGDLDPKTGRPREYAMKIELNNKAIHPRPTLAMDVEVLNKVGGKDGFVTKVEAFTGSMDSNGNKIFCLVMGLVGMTLQRLAGQELSPKCVINSGDKILTAIEFLHEAGYLHRDMKPENWAIGRPPDQRKFYLLDLGMCRRYKRRDGGLRAERSKAPGRGTRMYASRAAHANMEQTPMDDIESWFFAFVELYAGKLPWSGKATRTIIIYKQALFDRKSKYRAELLATIPKSWEQILDMIDTGKDKHTVDYAKIHKILHDTMDEYPGVHKYDWEFRTPITTYLRLMLLPWWKKPNDVFLMYNSSDGDMAADSGDDTGDKPKSESKVDTKKPNSNPKSTTNQKSTQKSAVLSTCSDDSVV